MVQSGGVKRGALVVLLAGALFVDGVAAGWVARALWRDGRDARDRQEAPAAPVSLNDSNTKPQASKAARGYDIGKIYLAAGYRWAVTRVGWQETPSGLSLKLSIGSNSALATGKPRGSLNPPQARVLCEAVLQDLPPGGPQDVERQDISRIGFRVYRPDLSASGSSARWQEHWSGWLTYYVVDGKCAGLTPAAAQDVLMSRAVERNYVARRGLWIIERESWVRQAGALQYRLWIRSARRIARDVPIALTPVTAWVLCNKVLEDLPEDRPEGVERKDISVVAFHMPGGNGSWVRQPVENAICTLPATTDRDDWLYAR